MWRDSVCGLSDGRPASSAISSHLSSGVAVNDGCGGGSCCCGCNGGCVCNDGCDGGGGCVCCGCVCCNCGGGGCARVASMAMSYLISSSNIANNPAHSCGTNWAYNKALVGTE